MITATYTVLHLKLEFALLIMGAGGNIHKKLNGLEYLALGYVDADEFKAICYSAADVFLFPTRADIWSLVVQEAMACGTPSVSFDVGGVSDLVRHKYTGLLLASVNAMGLKDAIIEALEDNTLREALSANCRKTSIVEYSLALQASRYLKLYNGLIKTNQ